jgi:hypothetical protein
MISLRPLWEPVVELRQSRTEIPDTLFVWTEQGVLVEKCREVSGSGLES